TNKRKSRPKKDLTPISNFARIQQVERGSLNLHQKGENDTMSLAQEATKVMREAAARLDELNAERDTLLARNRELEGALAATAKTIAVWRERVAEQNCACQECRTILLCAKEIEQALAGVLQAAEPHKHVDMLEAMLCPDCKSFVPEKVP